MQVLGCGIAVAICLGGAKLAHTHWQLRKYSVADEKERKEQALHREMSQKRRGSGVPRADEALFGIRALERGVEVEGVWVSRGNTPEPSIRNGSSGSSIWDFMPKKTVELDVEKQAQEGEQPRTTHRGRAISDSAIGAARPGDLTFNRDRSAVSLTSGPANRDSVPKASLAKPAKSQHPPPSFAKYSGNPSLHRQTSAVQTFEGIEAVHRASTYPDPEARHGGNSSESYTQSNSGSSSSGSGPISSAAPALLSQKPRARPRHHSADFELLNSHRQSQAAETGQLTPRTRKLTNSMDVQGYASDGITSSGSDDLGYSATKSKAASTPSPPKGDPSPPKVAALPAAVRRSSIPDVTPFAQFVQTAPTPPLPASSHSLGSEEEKISEVPRPAVQVLTTPHSSILVSPTKEPSSSKPEQTVAGAVRHSFEKERRGSQVIRGHGTGFEILKPGSLPAAPVPPASPPSEKQNGLPPVSLQNHGRMRSRSRSRPRSGSLGGGGRKLQKKKRQSSLDQASLDGI
jgi:hypothetical protein